MNFDAETDAIQHGHVTILNDQLLISNPDEMSNFATI